MTQIADNIAFVNEKIHESAGKAGRDSSDITLVAVSKTHSVQIINEAYDAGHRVFGENRVQEAVPKIEALPDDIQWHLVGHLQRNKVKKAFPGFSFMQSLDSLRLARALSSHLADEKLQIDVLIQVDIAGEESKYGIDTEELSSLHDFIDSDNYMNLKGLMCIPPFFSNPEDSRPYFVKLRKLLDNINKKYNKEYVELSMGMSNDYHVAVEEGATIVRVGTAIFGERNYS